jgi:predicted acylesterase/phospholipase RssA
MRRTIPLPLTTIAIAYIWNKGQSFAYESSPASFLRNIARNATSGSCSELGEMPKKISIDIPIPIHDTLPPLLQTMHNNEVEKNDTIGHDTTGASSETAETFAYKCESGGSVGTAECDKGACSGSRIHRRGCILVGESDPATPENAPNNTPKFPDTIRHIVISGGGELGFAFYSALRESNRAGFWKRENIETIYATSAGAIFAVHVALLDHFGWEIIDDFLLKRPWNVLFCINLAKITKSFDQRGLFGKKEFDEMFSQMFSAVDIPLTITMKEFYELTKIEIHIMTAELTQFELVDVSYKTHPDWPFLDAIYCSASIPIFFAPHIVDGRIYLDGGLICNYPINQCLARVENPNEILGLTRRFNPSTEPPKINTLFDYLMFIIRTIFNRISLKQQHVKNQIDFVCDEETINIYKLYETFQSYNSRVLLFEKGVESWNAFMKERLHQDSEAMSSRR